MRQSHGDFDVLNSARIYSPAHATPAQSDIYSQPVIRAVYHRALYCALGPFTNSMRVPPRVSICTNQSSPTVLGAADAPVPFVQKGYIDIPVDRLDTIEEGW